MQSEMKFFIAIMCALPFAALADWRLSMTPASVQVDFGAPGIMELRISNTGDSTSPVVSVTSEGYRFDAVEMDYEVTPLSGGCGNWNTVNQGFLFQVASQFSIPAVPPHSELRCQYNFVARRLGVESFDELFTYYAGTGTPIEIGSTKIGGLTDLGATANLISTSQVNGKSVNRYRLNVQNFGQFAVEQYGFGACPQDPQNYTIETNFPGGCSLPNAPLGCFDKIQFAAGPIQPRQQATCEFKTVGAENPDLNVIRLLTVIRRPPPDNRALLDINPENDSLRLVAADPIEVPILSWFGLMLLIFGLTLVARRTV